MPIRRHDERQHALPFRAEFLSVLDRILKPSKPRKTIIETRVEYVRDHRNEAKISELEMLNDGLKGRGDTYRAMTLKVMKFTKRLLNEAADAMAAEEYTDFDMDFEVLGDELEEITESYDRELSRSHKEQQRELAKLRAYTSRKPSGKPSAAPAAPRTPI